MKDKFPIGRIVKVKPSNSFIWDGCMGVVVATNKKYVTVFMIKNPNSAIRVRTWNFYEKEIELI